jgi:NADH:ubiquinone oxidoreductase subunit E
MNREDILKKFPASGDQLLAILHELQSSNKQNYLSEEDLRAAARYLGLSYSMVHGVATFYTMYSLKPRGRHLVRICQSPPCHLMGSTQVSRELMKQLGIAFGETTPDGLFSLEMTSCLGVCGVAPAMMVDGDVYGNLTPERIKTVLEAKRREQ